MKWRLAKEKSSVHVCPWVNVSVCSLSLKNLELTLINFFNKGFFLSKESSTLKINTPCVQMIEVAYT